MTQTRKIQAVAFALACLLGVFRLVLPSLVKAGVNRQLSRLTGYVGHIDGIGLSLWRGAYQIKNMNIQKKEGKAPVPFFQAALMDIGLQWKALLAGRIVASVAIDQGQLNFVNGPGKNDGQSGKGEDWQQLLESLVPATINHFTLQDSEIHFRDPYGSPPVDIHLDGLALAAENLSSRDSGKGAVLGSVSASATLMNDARALFQARFNPFAPAPTFDYGLTLEGLKLRELNPFLLRYAGMDVQDGAIDFYSEAAAADGKFRGYLKPMVKGLKVMKPNEPLNPLMLAKKSLVAVLAWVFKNGQGQVAAKFEFAGEYKDPHMSLWQAVVTLFDNAFIKALPPKLEGAIKVEDLQKKGAP